MHTVTATDISPAFMAVVGAARANTGSNSEAADQINGWLKSIGINRISAYGKKRSIGWMDNRGGYNVPPSQAARIMEGSQAWGAYCEAAISRVQAKRATNQDQDDRVIRTQFTARKRTL